MIKIVKLISGEELVGDVTVESDRLNISKPAMLQLMPHRNDPNQFMVGLIPYAQYTKSHAVEMNMDHILWVEEPIDDLYNNYNTMFGTGIQLV